MDAIFTKGNLVCDLVIRTFFSTSTDSCRAKTCGFRVKHTKKYTHTQQRYQSLLIWVVLTMLTLISGVLRSKRVFLCL